jgi:S-formylglutathione hydrolase
MFRVALFFASFAVIAGQRPPDKTIPEPPSPHPATRGRIVSDTFLSRSLEGNLLGDAAHRSVLVYLPPTYDRNPAKRYPVIYLLHGYGHDPRQWVSGRFQGMNLGEAIDKLIGEGRISEMIVVMPNARNRYHGSHYVNSEVTGRWADAIARELVAYIDIKYRTIASPHSRGIAGWSMGGRGALYLALMYPGVYGAVYGLSSGYFDFAHSPIVTDDVWERVLSIMQGNPDSYEFKVPEQIAEMRVISLATAFSPNPQRRPFLCDLPIELADGKLQSIPAVWQRWLNYDPFVLVRSRTRNLRRLRALQFDCGRSDPLLEGNRIFAKGLDAAGIRHTFEEYDGTHDDHIAERIETRLLPFFSRRLRK